MNTGSISCDVKLVPDPSEGKVALPSDAWHGKSRVGGDKTAISCGLPVCALTKQSLNR